MTSRHGDPASYRIARSKFEEYMRRTTLSNVADQRKSSSMYERVEFWLAHFSWLYPDDFEELQALAAEVSKERERISRATIFERKE